MTDRICDVEGCGRPSRARGWCQSHYARWRRTGDLSPDLPLKQQSQTDTCKIDGCDLPHLAQGWCSRHYDRWRRHGDPIAGRYPVPPDTVCAFAGCDRSPKAKGLCQRHYDRWMYGGTHPLVGCVVCRHVGCGQIEDEVRRARRVGLAAVAAVWKRWGIEPKAGYRHMLRHADNIQHAERMAQYEVDRARFMRGLAVLGI